MSNAQGRGMQPRASLYTRQACFMRPDVELKGHRHTVSIHNDLIPKLISVGDIEYLDGRIIYEGVVISQNELLV